MEKSVGNVFHLSQHVNMAIFSNVIETSTLDIVYVVYFDQLLGAARTQKLVKTLFSAVFNHYDLKLMKKSALNKQIILPVEHRSYNRVFKMSSPFLKPHPHP